VVGILGAGNFEAPIEVLQKMFLEKKVHVLSPSASGGGGGGLLFFLSGACFFWLY